MDQPVADAGVLDRELFELEVHLAVEVVAQEEGPEAEERVHLLRAADAHALAVGEATLAELAIGLLSEAALLEEAERRMMEGQQLVRLRQAAAQHVQRRVVDGRHSGRDRIVLLADWHVRGCCQIERVVASARPGLCGRRAACRRGGGGSGLHSAVEHPADVALDWRVDAVARLALVRRARLDRTRLLDHRVEAVARHRRHVTRLLHVMMMMMRMRMMTVLTDVMGGRNGDRVEREAI